METQERICRLCLKVCDNFKAVEGDMKDVLDVVLPKLDLDAIQELVVCTHCTEMLIKCSGFKTTCLNAYNCIVSFANCRDDVKLNLRDVYLSKRENGTIVAGDQAICGFCMDPIRNCSAISFDVEEKNVPLEKMMEQCLPELDLSLIEKLEICTPCHGSLKNYFYFVMNCLLVGEKVKKYCETQDINSRGQIELSRLLEFTARDVITSEINGNLVDITKEEKQFWGERGNADERIIDNEEIYKSERVFCGDSENTAEESKELDGIKIRETFCGENKTSLKEENFFEVENHELLESKESTKMETDEPGFIRFEEGLDMPLSDVTAINCKLYKCDFCSYETREIEPFKKHRMVHKIPSEVTMYKCNFCPYQAKRKKYLKQHSLKHKDLSEVTMDTCDPCSYQSKYKDYLKKPLLAPKETDPSKVTVYKCDTCSFQSKYKSNLKKHVLGHEEMDPSRLTVYKCDFCPYRTRRKDHSLRHLLRHKDPSEVTMYRCDSCSYQSKYKDDLKNHLLGHMEMDPSKVTMYKCDFCPYRTRRKDHILRHLLIHKDTLEATMYTCDTCSYQSKYKSDLRKHLVTHKDLSEVTVYKCDFCLYETRRKGGLKQHLLRHKEKDHSEVTVYKYKCDFCPYQAKTKGHMLRHLLSHRDPSEVTMFTCDTCSYQSKYKSSLKRHLLAHKEIDPSRVTVYKCDTCSYQSKYKGTLKRHILVHKEKGLSTVTV